MPEPKKNTLADRPTFDPWLFSHLACRSVNYSRTPAYPKLLIEKGLSEKEIAEILVEIRESERMRIGDELREAIFPLSAVANRYLDFMVTKTEKQKFAKEHIRTALFSAIENVKDISAQLLFSQNMEYSLFQMLGALVDRIRHTRPIKIYLTCCSYCRLAIINKLSVNNPQLRIACYRIVQEQLNNIVKHSKATEAEIRICRPAGFLSIMIVDNGIGFDTKKPAGGGGLENIATRLSLLEGEMKIISSPGKGCLLKIKIPTE